MLANIYIFTFFYIIILCSIIGYGLIFINLTLTKTRKINIGYVGIYGVFLLILYSYISNLFLAHNQIHNSILILIGLSFFYYFFFIKKENLKELKLFFIVFVILFISSLIFKTHDDFPYYHFPYTYYLTQNNSYVGIGTFNHGFRTPSSIFYLSSLFYLPVIKMKMFHISAIALMGFANIIFILKIFENFKEKKINFITYFSLFALIFINIFFYRISEHGTDRSAQILILILIMEILLFTNFNYDYKIQGSKILILTGIIISLKAFYVLYLGFFIIILYWLIKNVKYKDIIKLIKKNNSLKFFLLILIAIIFHNVLNTGCLIYPLSTSCFPNLSWTIDVAQVDNMNNWYEQWSKSGAGPNFRVDNPEEYIQGFNWVSNWFDNYFFNKVSDFLFGILFVVLVFFLSFYSKKKISSNLKDSKYIFSLYVILILFFMEWFYNHPALRYGGYSLIFCLIVIPTSLIFEKFKQDNKVIKKKFLIFISISFIIFFGRNINRIYNEINIYYYKPISHTFFSIEKKNYRFDKLFNELITNYNNCKIKINNCDTELKPLVSRSFNLYIFSNSK